MDQATRLVRSALPAPAVLAAVRAIMLRACHLRRAPVHMSHLPRHPGPPAPAGSAPDRGCNATTLHGVRWAQLVEPVTLARRSGAAVRSGRAVRAQAAQVHCQNSGSDRALRAVNALVAVTLVAAVVGSIVNAASRHANADRKPQAPSQAPAAAMPGPTLPREPTGGVLTAGPATASPGARRAAAPDAPPVSNPAALPAAHRNAPNSHPGTARVSNPPEARKHPAAARDRAAAAAGSRRDEPPPATGAAPAPDPVAGPDGGAAALTLSRAAAPFFIGRMDLVSEPRRVQLATAGSDPAAPEAWRRVGDAPAPGWTLLGIAPEAVTLLTPGGTVVNLVP